MKNEGRLFFHHEAHEEHEVTTFFAFLRVLRELRGLLHIRLCLDLCSFNIEAGPCCIAEQLKYFLCVYSVPSAFVPLCLPLPHIPAVSPAC